ncbi:MAG: hypothetical protein QG617_241 [Campylobacterota bacterium]|nr:hypothetical protein [Campylobacterota bacterium]
MNIKKAIKYTLIAIPLLLLAKFGIEKVIYDTNKIPEINLHPKEKLKIYGKFPLDPKSYYIKATVRYIATNPKCDNVIWLAGTRFAQDEQVDVNATMSDDHYELNIDRDYYKKGVCDWQVGEVGIVTTQKKTSQPSYRVDFSTKKSGTGAFKFKRDLLKAKSPLNLVCNYEYVSKDYTRYFCEDSAQNIGAQMMINSGSGSTYMDIFLSDLRKEFEVNFKYMAEPTQKIKHGDK